MSQLCVFSRCEVKGTKSQCEVLQCPQQEDAQPRRPTARCPILRGMTEISVVTELEVIL